MGLFSFIGGLFGGGSQKKAAAQATQAQVDAYNRGIALQQQQYDQTRADYLPYTQAGVKAIGSVSDLLGLNGNDAAQAGIHALKDGALYNSLFNNGQEALLQNASATGGLRGGNFQRASMDFGADVLANVYQNQLANLNGLAGLGVGATGSVANAGLANANAATQLNSQIGQAQANKYLANGRINAQNWANAGSFLDSIGSSFVPGGGGLQAALKSIF